MLKQPGNAKGAAGPPQTAKAQRESGATTEDLINKLSNERLALYREGAGRPLAREVRARLAEIVRELDRLWEQRRRELAGPQAVEAPPGPPKARPHGQPQVA